VVGYTVPAGQPDRVRGAARRGLRRWAADLCGRGRQRILATQLDAVRAELDTHRRDTPPCEGRCLPGADTTWWSRTSSARWRYKEWTDEPLLRQPVFLRFRDDKPLDRVRAGGAGAAAELAVAEPPPPPKREVAFSNLDKVFWPEEGYTKGDLVAYYRAIARGCCRGCGNGPSCSPGIPMASPEVVFPEGRARVRPRLAPHRADVERAGAARDRLLRLRRRAVAPLPGQHGRDSAARLGEPDRVAGAAGLVRRVDLDPKEAPFHHVVRVALALHRLCGDIGLPHYVKTSGSSGLTC